MTMQPTFQDFSVAIQKQFKKMSKHPLYLLDIDTNTLWDFYLNSFPEGTNPMFRERSEHDCSTCRSFIKTVGALIAINNNYEVITLWDCATKGFYEEVAQKMNLFLLDYLEENPQSISNYFYHFQPIVGQARNLEQIEGQIVSWHHFNITVPSKHIRNKAQMGSYKNIHQTNQQILLSALEQLSIDATETVKDLISENALYRGQEKKNLIKSFLKLQKEFVKCNNPLAKNLFTWYHSILDSSSCRINTDVIGTLLLDITKNVDLEIAVKKFENKVSGTNYQRPTALITPRMRDQAKEKLETLGLLPSLERRVATTLDLNINNLYFLNKSTRNKLDISILDSLPVVEKKTKKRLIKEQEISIQDFIKNVLPTAEKVEALFENRLANNLVSLIGPTNPTAPSLFQWNNNFSWSYKGEVADSIKEKVKAAGGKIDAYLCCRLAWHNHDDLDLHMIENTQNNRTYEVYFANARKASPSGGILDVDMNAGSPQEDNPVENIYYTNKHIKMKDGTYDLRVHQYTKRPMRKSGLTSGFTVEIELDKKVYTYTYNQPVIQNATIKVATLTKKRR